MSQLRIAILIIKNNGQDALNNKRYRDTNKSTNIPTYK
jgi:hypothetical protein